MLHVSAWVTEELTHALTILPPQSMRAHTTPQKPAPHFHALGGSILEARTIGPLEGESEVFAFFFFFFRPVAFILREGKNISPGTKGGGAGKGEKGRGRR